MTAVIIGLVILAAVAATAVALSWLSQRSTVQRATRTPSSSLTPRSTTSAEGERTTSPTPALNTTNIAGEASTTAPSAAPNGHDKAGNTTSYGIAHLTDRDPTTAWRIVGDGSGADIVLSFAAPRIITKVGLINGYAKTDPVTGEDRYRQERRISAVTWSFDDGTTLSQRLSISRRGVQMLPLPRPEQTQIVRLHILAVSGYTRPFNYTAISEIELDGA